MRVGRPLSLRIAVSFVSTQPQLPSALRARRLALPLLLVSSLTAVLLLPGLGSSVLRRSGAFGHAHLPPHGSGHGHTVKRAAQNLILTIESTHPGRKFALGAVGLSIEARELATPDLSASHKSLVALMRLLGPGVLRVGGNSLDYSWWTGDGGASPAWATSVITPSALVTLRDLLVATDWRAILGVDFGHVEPQRAANEASIAKRILGSRLLGIEIGNEPNAYSTSLINLRGSAYNVSAYLKELSAYSAAIHTTSPAIRLYGPELSTPGWLMAIASDARVPFAVLTEHYYPTFYSVPRDGCKGTSRPTAHALLSPQVREEENTMLELLVTAGRIAHRKTRISETNTTTSCDTGGGPATSPVFASALWSLDWVLRAASAGISGLNFHGYFGVCTPAGYSPVCAPSDAAEARGQVVPRPEYYGLLAARQLEGGRFVPVDIRGQRPSEDFTAYATVHSRGTMTLAIDNFATIGLTNVILKIPGYGKATGKPLIGPSISATSGVTFGHASIGVGGTLRPTEIIGRKVRGAFRFELAPTSAIVITLHR